MGPNYCTGHFKSVSYNGATLYPACFLDTGDSGFSFPIKMKSGNSLDCHLLLKTEISLRFSCLFSLFLVYQCVRSVRDGLFVLKLTEQTLADSVKIVVSFRHATTCLSPRDKLDMQRLFEILALKLACNSEKMAMALSSEFLPHVPEALRSDTEQLKSRHAGSHL